MSVLKALDALDGTASVSTPAPVSAADGSPSAA